MSDGHEGPIPTEINLHRKSRLLRIQFSDGRAFSLPCEYLRVHSPAADVSRRGTPETGKESVNIDRIEPQGRYAIRLVFDDGHDTGLYSWATLYDLGIHQATYWQAYLDRVAAAGGDRSGRGAGDTPATGRPLTLLYFSYLATRMRRESEQLSVPEAVGTVAQLLAWLRQVKVERGYLFADDRVRVTVNKQFAEPFTRLDPGDEIAIVPNSPNPPPPPQR